MTQNYEISSAIDQLTAVFGSQFSTQQQVRTQHCHSETWLPKELPDGVLFAEHKDDIKKAVDICREHRCPIIPFGIGSSLEGHTNAPLGGISIDTTALNRVVAISEDDLLVTVEPGMTRETLNEYLRDTGLFFPIDPGANATIGGMAATRASGTNAVRYGTMKHAVVSIEAVLPNGEWLKSATHAKKSSAGYDLTSLLVGSEGTLAIFTEITLRLVGRPETVAGGKVVFPNLDAACQSVMQTIQYGIPIARIELLDPVQVKASNQYSGLKLKELPTLFFEFHGSKSAVRDQISLFRDICDELGANDFDYSDDQHQLNALWKARHDAYLAAKALRPGCAPYATDVCVPISRLAECVDATRHDIEKNGLIGPIVGHVGDGNFHTLLVVSPDDQDERARAERVIKNLNERALKMGGTCTGEHGIGQGKKKTLVKEHGQSAINVMQSIKHAIDPDNIFNPGKII